MSLTHYLFNDYRGLSPFDHFLDDLLSNRANRQGEQSDGFRPRLDIHQDEKANNLTATFEVPGMEKEDISIELHNNILTVSGETEESSKRGEEGYIHRERRCGKFTRSLSLPEGVKKEDIKAGMANGVVNVTFPKSAPETSPTRIYIE